MLLLGCGLVSGLGLFGCLQLEMFFGERPRLNGKSICMKLGDTLSIERQRAQGKKVR